MKICCVCDKIIPRGHSYGKVGARFCHLPACCYYKEENMGDLMGICQDDIKKAYKNGCEEVKKTLGDLFPSLKLGDKPKLYSLDELTIELKENLYGQFIKIRTPVDSFTSAAHCKDEGGYIWVPFYKYEGMRLSSKGAHLNFEIPRD